MSNPNPYSARAHKLARERHDAAARRVSLLRDWRNSATDDTCVVGFIPILDQWLDEAEQELAAARRHHDAIWMQMPNPDGGKMPALIV